MARNFLSTMLNWNKLVDCLLSCLNNKNVKSYELWDDRKVLGRFKLPFNTLNVTFSQRWPTDRLTDRRTTRLLEVLRAAKNKIEYMACIGAKLRKICIPFVFNGPFGGHRHLWCLIWVLKSCLKLWPICLMEASEGWSDLPSIVPPIWLRKSA